MASDFDKLFGDDWRPQDSESDGGSASLRGRGETPESDPLDGGVFGTFPTFAGSDGFFGGEEQPPHNFTSENENRLPKQLHEKEVKVMGIFMHQDQKLPPQHFVLLRDNKGRRVPIWVGQFEAWAIQFALEGDVPERPLTHDLIKQLLDRMGATVDRVIIDDLWNETFYAKIGLVKPGGETLDIDARPSDAIALAVRARAPIYMAESVLEATVRTE